MRLIAVKLRNVKIENFFKSEKFEFSSFEKNPPHTQNTDNLFLNIEYDLMNYLFK